MLNEGSVEAVEQTGLPGGLLWSPLAPADIRGELLLKASLVFLILLLSRGCNAMRMPFERLSSSVGQGVYKNVTRAKEIGGMC